VSDAELAELAAMDARLQLVPGYAHAETPVGSQGAVQAFCGQLAPGELDRRSG
jgi:hypothetical protein